MEVVSSKNYKMFSLRKRWRYLTRMGSRLQGRYSEWRHIASAFAIQILLTNVKLKCRFLQLARFNKRLIFKWIHRLLIGLVYEVGVAKVLALFILPKLSLDQIQGQINWCLVICMYLLIKQLLKRMLIQLFKEELSIK